MTEFVKAVYERDSTLWKNANSVFKATDWVKMECIYMDKSDDREFSKQNGVRVYDNNGNDITDTFEADKYIIRLTNKRNNNTKDFMYDNKDDANEFFKYVIHNNVFTGWRKVS